ncbi:MAG TPA: N,N-dimethylformamidase beta subunit family domain-containing protein, partial [Acidimicrobiia bacterium]|nr:N,N-dimethylformamidase beta subunit family domain-containing protein [Acidimicrobiia bacterium]
MRSGSPRANSGRMWRGGALLAIYALVVAIPVAIAPHAHAAGPCGPPVVSVIACENSKPGDPPSDWQVAGAGDSSIQGFGTSMSVNLGQTISFKISTPASSYHIDILRIGYYQGDGARMIAAGLTPSAHLPQSQPACLNDPSTGLIDCGNWGVSASWTVPTNAVSGVYEAHLVRNDTGGDSAILFVVRDDSSHSDLLYQTSDTTWEAYNSYGGNSLYVGNPAGRAYKVSYNRPFITADGATFHDSFFSAEYPMVRFLEANGYDVSYTSEMDTDLRGSLLENHKVFLSSGHDEYWSAAQRNNVEAARDAGVNLAFFSANESFWKTRWEPSIDGSNTPYRTLVTYKETHANAIIDPQDPPTTTASWRDPRFGAPADGDRPENAMSGQFFIVNGGSGDIQVPAQYKSLRFWRNTAVANLAPGTTLTLAPGANTLGYEWDIDSDNGFRPAGLIDMSSTTASVQAFVDYGNIVANNVSETHHLTLYKAPSGALVFGAGTIQWSFGLDSANPAGKPADPNMQQATVNLLADMGAQPASLISGLTAATKSTDNTPPTSTITSPTAGSTLPDTGQVTVTGTATDTGGGVVAGVEVSTDGGATWHPAQGTNNFTYSWTVRGSPTTRILSRAIDDSGNIETPGPGITVNVACPCSIWGPTDTPGSIDSADPHAIELGVKFRSDTAGYITGVRFYKASTNTGTHIGNLWTSSGQLMATATFTGESGSGWQQVNFASPVPIAANTTYVASYYAPVGHYSESEEYFLPPPSPPPTGGGIVDSPPLHALRNTGSTTNGVYIYARSSTFPTTSYNAENYWVDPVYSATTAPPPAPGTPTAVAAVAGSNSATVTWNAPTTGGAPSSYIVTPFIGAAAQPTTTVSGTPPPLTANVTGLTNGTTYTFTVTASNATGNGPASAHSNSVTPAPPPPPGTPTNVSASAGNAAAAVSWSAPSTGGPPTSYTVTPFIGSTAQAATIITGTPPITSTVITGLTNGSTYTFKVTASGDGGTGPSSAASNAVTPSPTQQILSLDRSVSVDGNSTITTPSLSTAAPGELLVAFASSDGASSPAQTLSISGGGLTWTLDQRSNTQLGTSEVWHATAASQLNNATFTSTPSTSGLDQSLTVVAFRGAAGVGSVVAAGAVNGAPTANLVTTGANSLVYGVGNDWDTATARALPTGQTLVHQWVDTTSGDTFWVQSISGTGGPAGSNVSITDTGPVADRWNLAAVEIVSPSSGKSNQTITFGALPNATLAQSPVTVSATASSGLPVTFSSVTAGVCTVAGSTVTLLATGTCTIQADQAGNGTYNPAPAVQQSFTVLPTKSDQTITFGALADTPITQSPVTVGATATSGLAVSFSSTTAAVCTVTGTSVTLLTTGTCTIQA